MSTARTKSLSLIIAGVLMAAAGRAPAAIIISEVDPFGSNGSDGYKIGRAHV